MPKLYDTADERRGMIYNSASSRQRRAEENQKVSPRGHLRVQQLDEETEMKRRHRRESTDQAHRHEVEKNTHSLTSRAIPTEMVERHKRAAERLAEKHEKERAAMQRKHEAERKRAVR